MRTAFVLNANAKQVTERLLGRLVDIAPVGDIYYSRSLQDSERFFRQILRKGYGRVFSGGGDGTIMQAINSIRQLSAEEGVQKLPQVGVLKLGTGNALATVLGAKRPDLDVHHVVGGGSASARSMNFVKCDDGTLAPFAGVGFDGEMINDYVTVKEQCAGTAWAPAMKTILGYLWAGFGRMLPRHINGKLPTIRVTTQSTAYRMVHQDGIDQEIEIPAGTVLYEGPSRIASVSSIQCFGYGLKMFPFAEHKQGFMHLRLSSIGVLPVILNLYPKIWNGSFRHPEIFDFLVKDVHIESQEALPYQVGGDARGWRKSLTFGVCENVIDMVELAPERLAVPKRLMGLLPAPAQI